MDRPQSVPGAVCKKQAKLAEWNTDHERRGPSTSRSSTKVQEYAAEMNSRRHQSLVLNREMEDARLRRGGGVNHFKFQISSAETSRFQISTAYSFQLASWSKTDLNSIASNSYGARTEIVNYVFDIRRVHLIFWFGLERSDWSRSFNSMPNPTLS